MVKTRTPGIYKRGNRYVIVYRAGGKQRKEYTKTLDQARRLKAARSSDAARPDFFEASKVTFHEYATKWIERHTGRRGEFRESSREDYRRHLDRYALHYFSDRKLLAGITRLDMAEFVAWLSDEQAQGLHTKALALLEKEAEKGGERDYIALLPDARRSNPPPHRLSHKTVRNIAATVRACLADAKDKDKIRTNPADGLVIPRQIEVADEDEDEVRVLTETQLMQVLEIVHPRHRLMFELLAATGLRWSELVALQWRHLELDGSQARVRVRRAIVRKRVQPPKSKYGRREVPLPAPIVQALRRRRAETEWPGDEDLVFPSQSGTHLDHSNTLRRVLRPALEEVGVAWAGFHTFRHTCATRLFYRGKNAVQVQRWLGHHSAAFTLATYVHFLPDELHEPLDLPGATPGVTDPTRNGSAATPDVEPASLVEALADAEIRDSTQTDRSPAAFS